MAPAPTTFRTKRDGEAYLSTVRADMDRGQWISPASGRVSLRDYATRWLEHRPDLRPRTVELYEGELGLHILPVPLTSIWWTPFLPVRERAAFRSRYAKAASRADSCASRTARAVSGSPSPARIDTDFGARNVRSKPATLRFGNRPSGPPVVGCSPAQMACRSFGRTRRPARAGLGRFRPSGRVLHRPLGSTRRLRRRRRSGNSSRRRAWPCRC